ncbi:MAG: hypothetical protein Q8M01_15820 [Rubrivivax sp.]|nr:hypothetical protein [Rubrivivax sp.]
MSEQRSKALAGAVVTVMTLSRDEHLDAAGRAALDAALDLLAQHSGRAVALAVVEWQRAGCLRRDPRPAPTREVGGAPLRKHEPFLSGRL